MYVCACDWASLHKRDACVLSAGNPWTEWTCAWALVHVCNDNCLQMCNNFSGFGFHSIHEQFCTIMYAGLQTNQSIENFSHEINSLYSSTWRQMYTCTCTLWCSIDSLLCVSWNYQTSGRWCLQWISSHQDCQPAPGHHAPREHQKPKSQPTYSNTIW